MKKKAAIFTVVSAVVIVAALIIFDTVRPKTETSSFFSMNTYCSAEIESKDAEKTLAEIQYTVENLDVNTLSRTAENSVVYTLNKNGEAELDADITAYFTLLADICKQSNGAFDYTLGAVSDLWNFGSTPSIPDETELAQALSHSGYEKFSVSGNKITLDDKKAVVDFGASGKGIALDSIGTYLSTQEVNRAVVSVGGSVLLYGKGDFTVGIRDPKGSTSSIATLRTAETCISTSGSYEQYFEKDGKRYHHILNPETGYPVDNGLVSVTVISESGLMSDALSTACFVLGIEKGTALAEHYGAKVIFITDENIIYTDSDTKSMLSVTDNNYRLAETK